MKRINEACDAVYELAFDSNFDDCEYEIVGIIGESESVIWSSDENSLVVEANKPAQKGGGKNAAKDAKTGQNKPGFWDKVKGAAGKLADGA